MNKVKLIKILMQNSIEKTVQKIYLNLRIKS